MTPAAGEPSPGLDPSTGALVVRRGVVIPAGALHWRFSRSGGPGGQKVNTSDTRVELSVDLTSAPGLSDLLRARAIERLAGRLDEGRLTVTASEERSQLRNREAAAARLAHQLRQATRPPAPPRRPTRPSRAAQERRISAKKERGQLKAARRRPEPE